MALMIQDNLIGKALEESDAFPEAAYESVQAFKDALRQAFPQSETVVASKEDQRNVKALRFYEALFIIDPETGDRDPPSYTSSERDGSDSTSQTLYIVVSHTCSSPVYMMYN